MKSTQAVHRAVLAGVLVLSGCYHSRAQAPVPPAPPADPPARVARISFVIGAVSIRPAGSEEWVNGDRNRPLTSGDSVWVTGGGRAELHLGSAAIRLDSRTRLDLLDVATNAVQLKLTKGAIAVRVRELDEGEEFEIDKPDAAIAILREGEYRVEVPEEGSTTTVIARSGMADVTGTGAPIALRAGQTIRMPEGEVAAAPVPDAFDAFARERERREETALASKYVSPRTIGYEDLAEYGDWRTDVSYGPVWTPRLAPPGWAPYRFGHWIWIEPWGWTWVDDAPWGFAPFHYGRWALAGAAWIWVPGPYHRYPIYAPALVIFAGGGGPGFRFYVRVGAGPGIAWFPLGPREVWHPPYRASRTYVTNINVRSTVVVNPGDIHRINIARQRYVNRSFAGAITAVPENAFRRAESIQRHSVQINQRDTTRIGGSAPPVAPVRESLGRRDGNVPAPPATRRQQVIVSRTPPPNPAPFEQRRPSLDSAAGRVPDRRQIDNTSPSQSRQTPDHRQQPRTQRQPSQRQPQTAPSRPETQRDQQWGRRTGREADQRSRQIESERQRTQPREGRPQAAPRERKR